MNWETFENSDWYREAHPEKFEKPSREEKKFEEINACVRAINSFYCEEDDEDDEERDETPSENKEGKKAHTIYVTTKIKFGRVYGIITSGDYRHCRMAMMDYNIDCIDSEWDWAGIDKIEYDNDDELEDILNFYRGAAEYYDEYGWDDEDY